MISLMITATSPQGRDIMWKCVDLREHRNRVAWFRDRGYTVRRAPETAVDLGDPMPVRAGEAPR